MNRVSLVSGICGISGITQTSKNEDDLLEVAQMVEEIFLTERSKSTSAESATYHEIDIRKLTPYSKLPLKVLVTARSVIFVSHQVQGKGTFKEMRQGVWVGEDGSGPTNVAVLQMLENEQNDHEIRMLKLFEGSNICPSIMEDLRVAMNSGTPETKTHILIETLINGGDLKAYVDLNRCTPKEILYVLYLLLHIIKEIHDKGYVHRDMKPENLLVDVETRDGRRHISGLIACDLGSLCQEGAREEGVSKFAGTPKYFSPESARKILQSQETSNLRPSDMWAVGILLLVLTENSAMLAQILSKQKFKIITDLYTRIASIQSPITPTDDLLERLAAKYLEPDPNGRVTARDALQDRELFHALIAGGLLLRGIEEGKIPFRQIYQDFLGVDGPEPLYRKYAKKKERLHSDSKTSVESLQASPVIDSRLAAPDSSRASVRFPTIATRSSASQSSSSIQLGFPTPVTRFPSAVSEEDSSVGSPAVTRPQTSRMSSVLSLPAIGRPTQSFRREFREGED